MKIQSLAVIFAIIILPIVIILSSYIHYEVDTIALQTSYDTKLIDSTHDAMSAFEINTANEDLSSVADSLRSIIDASTNVFFNTLATNLGVSNAGNSAVSSYVPAILYTLYDGYYIYSPTRVPTVLTYEGDEVIYVGDRGVTLNSATNEVGVYNFDKTEYAKEKDDDYSNNESEATKSARQSTLYSSLPDSLKYEYGQMLYENEDGTYSTQLHSGISGISDTKYTQEHVLKSYMPYSARYVKSSASDKFDVTINYTLDNYLTVEGSINDVYYSKTGYLISQDTVTNSNIGGITDILTYNEITAEEIILSGEYDISITIDPIMENNQRASTTGNAIEINYTRQYDDEGNVLSYTKLKERINKLSEDQDANIAQIQDLEYELANLSSIAYYVKAQIFSNWVYANLSTIKASDISEDIAELNEGIYTTDKKTDIFHKFDEDSTQIFNPSQNPELEDSPFYSHKLEVIRNNIQYNLNLAISAYNEMLQSSNIQMPAIKDSEWEQILTRVSVVSFMQGLNCGLKTYNNYAISSSTNNELTVIPTEMYYVYKNDYNRIDSTEEYHKIDCDKLDDGEYISFKSKEVKYDKIYDKESKTYIYDHRNLACYRCAVASNYKKLIAKNGADEVYGYSDDIKISLLSEAKRKAYYIALGKERQELYKTNAITDSNGYEIYYNDSNGENVEFAEGATTATIVSGTSSKRNLSDLREVEITLKDLKCTNESEATVNFHLIINGAYEVNYNVVLNLAQSTPQTMVIPVHINDDKAITSIALKKVDLADKVTCKKLNTRLIYE